MTARRILRRRLGDVEKALGAFLDADGVGAEARAIHFLRVACRRADTALQSLGACVKRSAAERVQTRLRRLRRRAGLVRDADVQIEHLRFREGQGRHARVLRGLIERIGRERDRDARRLRGWLDRGRAEKLTRALRVLVDSAREPEGGLAALGRSSVSSLGASALELAGSRLEEPANLHALRLAVKRVRYAIEAFGPVLGPGLAGDVEPVLQRAQQRLGRITDAEQLLIRLHEHGDAGAGAAALRGELAREAAELHAGFIRGLGRSGLARALARCARAGEPAAGRASGRARVGGRARVLAAIDLGSNAARLRVESVDAQGKRRVLAEDRRPTRLGGGLASGSRLPAAGVSAALGALREFASTARRLGAERVEAVATAAVRESSDGAAFVRRVKASTGLTLRVIDAREEADLALRSARSAAPLGPRERLGLIDIGGGSVEVGVSIGGVSVRMVSMPLGAVRLTDAFGGAEGSSGPRFEAMCGHIERTLDGGLGSGRIDESLRPSVVCGAGGTFTALGMLERGVLAQDGVSGPATVSKRRVAELLESVRRMPVSRRLELPGVTPDRAEIFVAGLAVLRAVLGRLSAERVTVCEGGVREGMILRMLEPGRGAEAAGPAASARALAERAQYEREHSEHVSRLALSLFDGLAGARGGGSAAVRRPDSRALLECGAVLHDAGILVSYAGHHRHGEAIVMHAPLAGLDEEQRRVVASLARYHRRGGPPGEGEDPAGHEVFASLPAARRAQARMLAGVLRVADGLDRAHESAVGRVGVRLMPRRLEVTASPAPGAGAAAVRAGIRAARKKSDVLASVLGREVVVRAGE